MNLLYKNRQYITGILLMVALFGCQAGMPVVKQSDSQLNESYTWFDGERQRKVWLNPDEIAEFTDYERQQRLGINRRALTDGAVLLKKQGNLRIWKVSDKEPGAQLRAFNRDDHRANYSPVFHATSAIRSPRMALPGNIIVAFSESWDLQKADQWLEEKGLKVLKSVIEEQGIFLVGSESGLASLSLANELSKTQEVRYAMPDWWRETFKR